MFRKGLKKYLATIVMLCGMVFSMNTPVYAAESANVDQANTELSIKLTRKIVPVEESGKNDIFGGTVSSQIKGNHPNDSKEYSSKLLPQTGITVNHLSILGGILVVISLLVLIFKKLRKED